MENQYNGMHWHSKPAPSNADGSNNVSTFPEARMTPEAAWIRTRSTAIIMAVALGIMCAAFCAAPRAAFADPATITVRATGRTEDGKTVTADEAEFILAASDEEIGLATEPTSYTITHPVANEEAWVFGSADTRPMRIASIVFSDSSGATIVTASDTNGNGEIDLNEVPAEIEVDGATIRRTGGSSLSGAAIEMHFEDVTASFTITYNFVFDPWQITFLADGEQVARYERWAFDFSGAAPEAPAKPGYIFKGWFDENNQPYNPNHMWQVDDEDQVLHAVYEQAYRVVFDSAGGALDGSTSTFGVTLESYDDVITLPANDPVRAGWTFTGWYLDDVLVTDGVTYGQLAGDADVRSLTLTAHWQKDASTQVPDETDDPGSHQDHQGAQGDQTDQTDAPNTDDKDGRLPATGAISSAAAVAAAITGASLIAFGSRARQIR